MDIELEHGTRDPETNVIAAACYQRAWDRLFHTRSYSLTLIPSRRSSMITAPLAARAAQDIR